ncbi:MAG TPA: class I SAM-dependent methyltransferase [Anaerolineales bacterium]|nr:class I SAM-dependent methyltransferase [Anaerolineales bacterium]
MSRFGSDPHAFFKSVYQNIPPWDVGGPQPALSALFDEYPPASPVLDLGCGSGDLAIALAQRRLEVTGIDFVEAAIEQARAKAGTLPAEVANLLDFQVGDALKPSLLKQQFGAVTDSGFLHLFESEPRDSFVEDLALALVPGGRYYLLAFAVDFGIPNVPRQVTEEELRMRFTSERGWRMLDIRPAEFLTHGTPPVPAIRACMERLPADNI